MGMFINVKISGDSATSEDCAKLVTLCPVDIFAQQDGKTVIVEENVDECTLCGLCTNGCAAVVIEKLYEE